MTRAVGMASCVALWVAACNSATPGTANGGESGIGGLTSDGMLMTTGASDSMGDSTTGASGSAGDDERGGVPKFDLGDGGDPPCFNLECAQVTCTTPTETTTIAGTVYDPSGTLPLYNVQVYVPNTPVAPISDELTCDQCSAQLSGSPLVSAVTDDHGRFVLENAPVGDNIPLVMQVGKWRRQVTIPAVQPCQANELEDHELTRLPRSRSEGDLPRIALTTGSADPLFCLLRRLNIDDSEYGIAGSDARIHFYLGSSGSTQFSAGFGASPGATFPNATTTLWADGWQNYDIVMLSCESDTYAGDKNEHREALRDYLDVGGRVFATHYHYTWMQGDAPSDLMSVASFTDVFSAVQGVVDIDTSFPKGQALAEWLYFVDGASPLGQFSVHDAREHTLSISPAAQQWVTHGVDDRIIYFSFNTPINAAETEQCGRMVYSDIHVSIDGGDPDGAFPAACNDSPLTEQEKVLLFMLFDLSACIAPDGPPG